MKCGYSREIIALYIEDDLPAAETREVVLRHISECADCDQYCQQLRASQSLIKSQLASRGQNAVSSETLASVRNAVMSQIGQTQHRLGWAVKLERLLFLGFRQQRYALAGFAVVAIVSASLLGQIQHSQEKPKMIRPAGYREWVFVGSGMYHNVYISAEAYREYSRSGKLPEGAFVKNEDGLQASVKDARCFSCHQM